MCFKCLCCDFARNIPLQLSTEKDVTTTKIAELEKTFSELAPYAMRVYIYIRDSDKRGTQLLHDTRSAYICAHAAKEFRSLYRPARIV